MDNDRCICVRARSAEGALAMARAYIFESKVILKEDVYNDIWVIGGLQTFQSFMPFVDKIYERVVINSNIGDTQWFFDTTDFELSHTSETSKDGKGIVMYDTFENLYVRRD
jgi:dihydrofolate reductase